VAKNITPPFQTYITARGRGEPARLICAAEFGAQDSCDLYHYFLTGLRTTEMTEVTLKVAMACEASGCLNCMSLGTGNRRFKLGH
jgi:hypothetical protein